MASLGDLFYNLHIQDFTDAEIKAINTKLASIGSNIRIDGAQIRTALEDALKNNPVSVTFNPVISAKQIEDKLTGQVINAEVKPLTATLVQHINDAIKGQPVNLDTFSINPDALGNAVRNALSGAGFTAAGNAFADAVEKSVKARLENGTYTAKVAIDIKKLADSVRAGLEQGEKRGITIDTKGIRKNLEDLLKTAIKVGIDPQIKVADIEGKLQGKVVRAEIVPLVNKLRSAIQDACRNGGPVEVSIGPKASLLQRLVTRVLRQQGYMINVSSITGMQQAIKNSLVGHNHITLTCDPVAISQSVRNALASTSTKSFGLEVSRDVLHRSIETALAGKKFDIQIQVMHDQARRAVQNALNNARMVGKDDALAYQRLQTGELKAAQAELIRLKAAHQSAANAASAHAKISANIGSVFGSNISLVGQLSSAMTSLYSIHAAKQFLSQVIEIGGELEHQKIALETIYGSESKMEGLYAQIKGLARQSPFGVMDLTKNVKQLSAYGVQYNEVYDTAKRLADISAATSVDINRLILAFGKTKNRTFLDGLEAKQFAYANIPIYDALSKKLTELEGKFVSVKDVMGRIKRREIGFDMVKEILWDMTDEGGKFYNMQEKLAGSVKTTWKLVRDNIELMFGEIAESQVGELLKDVGVIAQNLTREWRTLSKVVAAGASAFGLYRLAVLTNNIALGASHAATLKSEVLKNKEIATNAKLAFSYRGLSAEEQRSIVLKGALAKITSNSIIKRNTLTTAEIKALVASKMLTRDLSARLVALGKISPLQARYLIQSGLMTKGDLGLAANARRSGLSFSIMGKRIRIASFRFKELAVSAGMAAKSMLGFIFNPATLGLAALSAGVALWSKNNEEMEKAKEIGDGIFSKAVDGAKELGNVIEGLGPSKELSGLELTQGIEQLENAIKDYSPTAIDDINNSLVTQDGHLRTLAERYDYLVDRVKTLVSSLQDVANSDMGDMVKTSIEATDEGWFNDNLITNAKDYTNALKKGESSITAFATKFKRHMIASVDAAIGADEGFENATQGMQSYEEKLKFLVDNQGEYTAAAKEFSNTLTGLNNLYKHGIKSFGNIDAIKDSREELESDNEKFIKRMNSEMRLKGINPFEMTDAQKTSLQSSLKYILDTMEGVGDDAKAIIAKDWEFAWGIVIMEDKIGPSMQEKFRRMANDSTDEFVRSAVRKLQYEGYKALDDAERKVVGDLMENAKTQAMADLKLTNQEMADYLKKHPIEQLITLTYTNDAPSDLAKELVQKHGYPGLTDHGNRYIKQWAKSNKIYDARNAARDDLQAAYSELEAAKKEGGEIQAKAQKTYDEIWSTLQYLEWTDIEVKDQKSNKHTSHKSQKDLIAEAFKRRFKDLKDAWAEYQKWQKSIGDEAAANKVAESGLFGDMSAEDIPRTAEEFKKTVEKLKSELEAVGFKGKSQRESLMNEYIKHILDIDKSIVDEKIKAALEVVEKAFEKKMVDYNLFEKIRKATGNEKLAYSFSFGLNGGETDYVKMIQAQFKALSDAAKKAHPEIVTLGFDAINEHNVTLLPEELQKAWRKAVEDIAKYRQQQREAVADLLSEYQSVQERLAKIEAEAQEKIAKVAKSGLPSDVAENITRRIRIKADYDKFTQSNEYLQFFGGIYALTQEQAESIGDKIRMHLNRELQAGTISAKEYYDEIEKIDSQLAKIRSVKSNVLTYLTKGTDGLADKQVEEIDGKRLQIMQKIERLENEVAKKRAEVKGLDDTAGQSALMDAETRLNTAKEELKIQTAIRDAIITNKEQWKDITDVVGVVSNVIHGVADAFKTLRDMADSFGFDTESDAWLNAEGIIDTMTTVVDGISKVLKSALSGDIGGIISGVASTLLTPITIWNKLHDKKLQKDIERSKKEFGNQQRMIDAIERRMDHFLGNIRNIRVIDAERELSEFSRIENRLRELKSKDKISISDLIEISSLSRQLDAMSPRIEAYREGGALGYERQLMKEQLEELERQKADMEAMKKKDPEALAELDSQIDEQRQKIREFAEEMASTVYGIDLTSWAEQIGDALVDAFAKGEDAAAAFDKTAGNILRSLVTKMISTDIIAPMFNNLRDYLFGEDGQSGAYGSDFKLDAAEVAAMKEYLDKIKNDGIPAAEGLFNAINDATGGLLSDTDEASGSLRAGIQNVTEDTADLLASYINAIRAYCAENNINFNTLIKESMPRLTLIVEAQLTQLNMIAENTHRNMLAAEAIQQNAQFIADTLRRATLSKDNGIYIR